jgi:hypothetical protein
VNAGDDEVSGAYIEGLTDDDFADLEHFLNQEARRHGVHIQRPVRVDRFAEVSEKPPERADDSGIFATMWWSLKMRMYANRNARPPNRAPPQIRIFVMYHDPNDTHSVPHSVGLQKGLVGVVHAYAEAEMSGPNNVVIVHEILHTLGASDKYDFASLAPLYPDGYAEPDNQPLYPQSIAEVMGGRYAIDEDSFAMPMSLDEVSVGDATAHEIGWPVPP